MYNPDDQLHSHKSYQQDQSYTQKDFDQSKHQENMDDSKIILKDTIKQTFGDLVDFQENKNRNMIETMQGEDHKSDNSGLMNKKNLKKSSELQNDISKQRRSEKISQLERSSLLKNYMLKESDSVNSHVQLKINMNEQVLKLNKLSISNPNDRSIISSKKKSSFESSERIQNSLHLKQIKSQNFFNNRQQIL